MKQFLLTLLTVMFCSMASQATTYTLVTSADDIQVGGKYIIVAKDHSYALSTTQNDTNRAAESITKSADGKTIDVTSDKVQVVTLEASNVSTHPYLLNVGTGYLYASSKSSNQLKTQEKANANSQASITINASTSRAEIKFNREGRYDLGFNINNGGNPLFACYASSASYQILLYKEDGAGDSREAVSLSWSETKVAGKMGQITYPTLTVTPEAARAEVKYSSDNADIVVDEATGEVTTEAIGTATITASIKGSETYRDASVSYTLTIIDPNYNGSVYTLVTKADQIVAGDQYIYVAHDTSNTVEGDYAMSAQDGKIRSYVAVDIVGNTITLDETSKVVSFILEASGTKTGTDEEKFYINLVGETVNGAPAYLKAPNSNEVNTVGKADATDFAISILTGNNAGKVGIFGNSRYLSYNFSYTRIACYSGLGSNAVAGYLYRLEDNTPKASAPVFAINDKPVSGKAEAKSGDLLSISSTGGDEIYIQYTMDGSPVDDDSELYTEPIPLKAGTYTVKAKASLDLEKWSSVSTLELTVASNVAAPTFAIGETTVSGEAKAFVGDAVTITGENVLYTVNGEDPLLDMSEGEIYEKPIALDEPGEYIIKAIAMNDNLDEASAVATLKVNVSYKVNEDVKINFYSSDEEILEGGETLALGTTIRLEAVTTSEEPLLFYTINGNAPTVNDKYLYDEPIVLNQGGEFTLKVIASDLTTYVSPVYTLNYTVVDPNVGEYTFDFTQGEGHTYGLTYMDDGDAYQKVPALVADENSHVNIDFEGTLRYWKNAVRMYKGSEITISVPDGHIITGVSFEGTFSGDCSASHGTYENKTWTPDTEKASNHVMFTSTHPSGNKELKKVTVKWTKGEVKHPGLPRLYIGEGENLQEINAEQDGWTHSYSYATNGHKWPVVMLQHDNTEEIYEIYASGNVIDIEEEETPAARAAAAPETIAYRGNVYRKLESDKKYYFAGDGTMNFFTRTTGATSPIHSVLFSETTGIENVAVDGEADVEYYTVGGVKVAAEQLMPGIYIRRQGSTVEKIAIR